MKFSTLMTWIGALRSGKYKKINGQLRNDKDGFCALGVLKYVMTQGEWFKSGNFEDLISMDSIGREYGLPFKIQRGTYHINDGLEDHTGKPVDIAGWKENSFEDVALYLEANKDEILGTDNEV